MPLNNLISRARFARAFLLISFHSFTFLAAKRCSLLFCPHGNEATRLWSVYFLSRNVVKQISQNVNREACPYTSKNIWLQKSGSTLCRFGYPSCLKLPVLTLNVSILLISVNLFARARN